MSIKIKKTDLQRIIREEYKNSLKEEVDSMTRESSEALKDIAKTIAGKLAREIEQASMSQQVDGNRLLDFVVKYAKIDVSE